MISRFPLLPSASGGFIGFNGVVQNGAIAHDLRSSQKQGFEYHAKSVAADDVAVSSPMATLAILPLFQPITSIRSVSVYEGEVYAAASMRPEHEEK